MKAIQIGKVEAILLDPDLSINEQVEKIYTFIREVIGEDEDTSDGHGGTSLAVMYGNAVREEQRKRARL